MATKFENALEAAEAAWDRIPAEERYDISADVAEQQDKSYEKTPAGADQLLAAGRVEWTYTTAQRWIEEGE